MGNPKEDQASVKSVLINLRCPMLSDYRWYKDVFLTNVLKREDGHQQFWKECLIAGLPILFGERILNRLRQNFATNDIPFNSLTFGQLFRIIKSEGLTYVMRSNYKPNIVQVKHNQDKKWAISVKPLD